MIALNPTMAGERIYRERDAAANGWYEQRYFIGADGKGNTVALFSEINGDLKARLWYTPSGEVHVVEGINGIDSLNEFFFGDPNNTSSNGTDFRHLFGQGRFLGGMVLANGERHGGITQFANGQQYDALLNAAVNIDNTFFWDVVNDVEYQNITWYDFAVCYG